MRLILSKDAKEDLNEIVAYTKKTHGLKQTFKYKETLLKECRNLLVFPDFGRKVISHPNLRRIEIEKHVVFYIVDDEAITIIRILHQSVDFLQALE
jgi:toxin ParE1/3/4